MVPLIEFACPVCGNPLYKSKYKKQQKMTFTCRWCKHLVDSDGNEVPRERKKTPMNTPDNKENG